MTGRTLYHVVAEGKVSIDRSLSVDPMAWSCRATFQLNRNVGEGERLAEGNQRPIRRGLAQLAASTDRALLGEWADGERVHISGYVALALGCYCGVRVV